MKQIKITGENTLTGEIKISGAKNSAVALIPAAILCDEQATIFNVPNISDIDALSEILEYLGAGVKRNEDAIIIDSDCKNMKFLCNSQMICLIFFVISTFLCKFANKYHKTHD